MPGELRLLNRQRTRPVNLRLFRRIALHLLAQHFRPASYELGVHLVDAEEMADINERFLQHSGSTDVITFDYTEAPPARGNLEQPMESLHGEIFISVPDALAQAREFETSWQSELARYLIHGLLHLHGYDDLSPGPRKEMKRHEELLLTLISHEFPLNQLYRRKQKAVKT